MSDNFCCRERLTDSSSEILDICISVLTRVSSKVLELKKFPYRSILKVFSYLSEDLLLSEASSDSRL